MASRQKPLLAELSEGTGQTHTREVAWAVVDELDPTNVRVAVGQTAFKAFENSGILRDGRRLSFGQCRVTYSERKTQEMWIEALVDAMQKLFSPAPPPRPCGFRKCRRRMNGSSNGSAA
jgi:hypothetical protein